MPRADSWKATPTVPRRQLGNALRKLRKTAGISQGEAGVHIGFDATRISRLEKGASTLRTVELERLIDLYNVPTADRAGLVRLGAKARSRVKPQAGGDALPASFRRLIDLEADAIAIYSYQPSVIPGLLQSLSYVRAAISAGNGVWWPPSQPTVESQIAYRLDRQKETWGSSRIQKLEFIIGEAAIVGVVESREVMREQLGHLLSIIYGRSDTNIYILPMDTAANPARDGGFTLLEFGDHLPRVGFSSIVHGPLTLNDEVEYTSTLAHAFNRLRGLSLSATDSATYLENATGRLTNDG